MTPAEEEDFNILYAKTSSGLFRRAYRLTQSQPTAQDIHQQTYLQAIRSWKVVSGLHYNQAYAWLHSALINEFLQLKRQKQPLQWGKPVEELADTLAARDADVEHRVTAALALEATLSDVATLPEQQRAVVVLHAIAGYKLVDTAGMLNIGSGTARSHLSHARKTLRDCVAHRSGGVD